MAKGAARADRFDRALASLRRDSSPVERGGTLRPTLAVLGGPSAMASRHARSRRRRPGSLRRCRPRRPRERELAGESSLVVLMPGTSSARASGSPLPVAYVASMGKTVIASITFEKWGVPVQVAAPSGPLAPTSKEILLPVPQKSLKPAPKKK